MRSDGPQRLEHAARAGGLLSDDIVLERDAFVQIPRRHAADTNLRNDEISAVQHGVQVRAALQGDVAVGVAQHAFGQPGHDGEALRVDVHEPHVGDR